MREVNYHNPIDYLESNIYILFDIVKNSQQINSNEDLLTIGFLFLSLRKDGLFKQEDLTDRNSFEQFRQDLIFKSDIDETQITYKQIFSVLEEKLSKLENSILQQISFKLFASNEINREILYQNFSKVFDNILYRYAKADGRHTGEFIQPLELTRFMCGLADLKEDAKIFNPFAGLASFGIYLNPKQVYVGQEFNQKTWALGALRIMAFERTAQSKYDCVDSVLNWPDSTEKFDLIISNPPFRMKLENQLREIEPNIKTVEQLIILKGLQSLKQNGKLVVLLHESFLYSSVQHEYNLRKFLVDEDLIDTIISLPGGILSNTGIASVILLINKKKDRPEKIRLIDAKSFVDDKDKRKKILNDQELLKLIHGVENNLNFDNQFIVKEPEQEYLSLNKNLNYSDFDRLIKYYQLEESDYNINIPKYFQKEINLNENENLVKLGEILELIKGQKVGNEKIGKAIQIRNLSNDKVDFILDVSNLEVVEFKGTNTYLLSETCLLLAMRGQILKPTLFKFNGEPIFRSQDILSFKIDKTRVDIAYLINELHADYVQEQLNSFRRNASVLPVIRREDLMKVVIKLPSIKEQLAKLEGINEVYKEQKKYETLANQEKQGILNEVTEQNNFLRHAIAGNLANLRGSFKKLKSIFDNQIKISNPEFMQLKESFKSDLTLEKLLLSIERDIEKVSLDTQRNSLGDSSINDALLESVEIIPFITDFVNEVLMNPNRNYEISLDLSKDDFVDTDGNEVKVFINGNKTLLKDMLNNIIENAIEHAFESDFRANNEISIDCFGSFTEDPSFYISISNNGKRLPKDFTYEMFIRKGSKAGPNAGNGYGGWYINQIINKHKGSLEIDDEQGPQGIGGIWSTSFQIELPILNFEKYD